MLCGFEYLFSNIANRIILIYLIHKKQDKKIDLFTILSNQLVAFVCIM